jgi:hypothetical protein
MADARARQCRGPKAAIDHCRLALSLWRVATAGRRSFNRHDWNDRQAIPEPAFETDQRIAWSPSDRTRQRLRCVTIPHPRAAPSTRMSQLPPTTDG